MKFYHVLAALFLTSSAALARPDVEITGQIKQTLTPENSPKHMLQIKPANNITLMGINLSDNAWNKLDERINSNNLLQNTASETECEASAEGCLDTQLGMNRVPVLDQGQHGSCATFANTAAIDAALNRGDYISQLCHLQLGRRLEKYGYNPSGWNGSLGPTVLNQIQAFGIIDKNKQRLMGCGGATQYPSDDSLPEKDMSVKAYHKLSVPLSEEDFGWTPILDIYQAFIDKTAPNQTLDAVKSSLRHNDRLTFGVLLFGVDLGIAGATGKYHATNDTWILTPEITDAILKRKHFGGHEMIITGFNDFAVAVDKNGQQHRGLLTLRNSWGSKIADKGNFYMSYDYFKLLTIEVQRIRTL